jgi:multidrug efflux system membrane fusion protein
MTGRALMILGLCIWLFAHSAVGSEPVQDAAAKAVRRDDKPSAEPSKIRVSASRPIQREVRDYVDLSGQVDSVMKVSLRAGVSGLIENVRCVPGQKVHKGDVLYSIDPQPYAAELDKAQAEVRVAQARLDAKRAEAEIEAREDKGRGKLSQLQSECKAAQASLEVAEKARDIAKINLAYTVLRSPIDGNILGPIVHAGNVAVADQTELATIVSADPMYVYFDVPQDLVLKLNRQRIDGKIKLEKGKGLPVRVSLEDGDGFSREGTVSFLNGAIHPVTGTARLRASIPNRDELLLPGMSARGRLTDVESHKALLVSGQALFSQLDLGNAYYVNVLTPEDRVKRRRVELGLEHGDLREVKQGLEPDEWVIIECVTTPFGVSFLHDGLRCDVEKVAMPERAPSGTRPPG